jgi:acetolactate decarboxylase
MPFAAYAAPIQWEERKLPRKIHTLNALELYLSETLGNTPAPVFLRLQLDEAEGSYHIVNVPAGTPVRKPDDAHAHNQPFPIRGPGDVLIFYSQNHKAVLTHHDTYLHAHWLNQTRTAAGHVDALGWRGPATLWVAAEKRTN